MENSEGSWSDFEYWRWMNWLRTGNCYYSTENLLLKCYCFLSEWYEMLNLQNACLLGWNTDGLYHGGEDPGSMSNMLWLSLPQQSPQPPVLQVLHSCPDSNHRSRIVRFIHTHSKWVHSFQKLQICQQNDTRYS